MDNNNHDRTISKADLMATVTIIIKDNQFGSVDIKAHYDPPLNQHDPKPTPAQNAAAQIYAMLAEMGKRGRSKG